MRWPRVTTLPPSNDAKNAGSAKISAPTYRSSVVTSLRYGASNRDATGPVTAQGAASAFSAGAISERSAASGLLQSRWMRTFGCLARMSPAAVAYESRKVSASTICRPDFGPRLPPGRWRRLSASRRLRALVVALRDKPVARSMAPTVGSQPESAASATASMDRVQVVNWSRRERISAGSLTTTRPDVRRMSTRPASSTQPRPFPPSHALAPSESLVAATTSTSGTRLARRSTSAGQPSLAQPIVKRCVAGPEPTVASKAGARLLARGVRYTPRPSGRAAVRARRTRAVSRSAVSIVLIISILLCAREVSIIR